MAVITVKMVALDDCASRSRLMIDLAIASDNRAGRSRPMIALWDVHKSSV